MTIRVKVSETGEIALPQAVRDARGWAAGTELELVDQGRVVVLRSIEPLDLEGGSDGLSDQVKAFLAMRPRISGSFPTDEQIDRLVLEEAARRFDATRD